MESKERLLDMLDRYAGANCGEETAVERFRCFISGCGSDDDLCDRRNMRGHITAGAFIVNRAMTHICMVEHKFLRRLLQPGGHTESGDATVFAAALREAVEETAVDAGLLVPLCEEPFDIDAHPIPANEAKGEGSHTHFDIRYLFRYDGDASSALFDPRESDGLKWITLDEFATTGDFGRTGAKVKRICAESWCRNIRMKHFGELTVGELHAITEAREEVFYLEQRVTCPDADDMDPVSTFMWVEDGSGRVVAFLRMIPAGALYGEASIGRMLVRSDCRRRGLCRTLMLRAMEHIGAPVRISAQSYLVDFYSSLGFRTVSDEYLEAGIPHRKMLFDGRR